MIYGKIKGLEKPVSRIFLGTANGRFLPGGNCNDVIDAAIEAGINAIDTARNYAVAEKSIGTWLKTPGNREKIILLSKCGHPDTETGKDRISDREIREDFQISMDYLGTDYLDIYLLHRDDPRIPAGEIVEIMNALIRENKILTYGGSNWTHERLSEAICYAEEHDLIPPIVSSPHYSLAEQVAIPWIGNCVSLTGNSQQDARDWYEKTQMPVLAYSPLCRGLLSGKFKSTEAHKAKEILDEAAIKGYLSEDNLKVLADCEKTAAELGSSVSQAALAGIFMSKMNMFVTVGCSSPQRVREAAKSVDFLQKLKTIKID